MTNPGGARCTVQDSAVNLLGRDPATGFARRPLDNTGVQYGLRRARRPALITAADFVDVNRAGRRLRHRRPTGSPSGCRWTRTWRRRVYRYGGVTGRGAPEDTPIIDLRYYVDLVPILGFHDQVRPYIFDARLAERGLGASHAIWNGVPLASDAVPVAHDWAEAIDAAYEVRRRPRRGRSPPARRPGRPTPASCRRRSSTSCRSSSLGPCRWSVRALRAGVRR